VRAVSPLSPGETGLPDKAGRLALIYAELRETSAKHHEGGQVSLGEAE
jgi:hypothetical protein